MILIMRNTTSAVVPVEILAIDNRLNVNGNSQGIPLGLNVSAIRCEKHPMQMPIQSIFNIGFTIRNDRYISIAYKIPLCKIPLWEHALPMFEKSFIFVFFPIHLKNIPIQHIGYEINGIFLPTVLCVWSASGRRLPAKEPAANTAEFTISVFPRYLFDI